MIHITPINDLKEHIECSTCECKPSIIIENGETIVVHKSYDGREYIENFTEEQKILLEFTPETKEECIKQNTSIFLYAFEKKELSLNDLKEMLLEAEKEEEFEVAISIRDAISFIESLNN